MNKNISKFSMPDQELQRKTISLVGFATKAGETLVGWESVKRGIERNKVAVVFISPKISQNSYKKVRNLLSKRDVPYFDTPEENEWEKVWAHPMQKIIGVSKGSIASKIIENFKTGV